MNKIILPVLLIVLSVGLFVMYIDPAYKDIKSLQVVNTQYNDARNKSKELRGIRDNLLKKYNSFSDLDLARIKKLLPDNVDNVRLVMDINMIASKYGAIIRNIQLNKTVDNGKSRINAKELKYGSVTLSFSMISGYDDFIKFITDLKNSLRLVDITSLDFSVIPKKAGIYKFNFTIKTYWLK